MEPPFGFDPGKLRNRRRFLLSRARAHLSAPVGVRERAFAATLLRDAAYMRLLMARAQDAAAARLASVGDRYLTLGVFGGAVLLALAGRSDDLYRHDRRMAGLASPQNERIDPQSVGPYPFLSSSLASPVQHLAILQTRWLARSRRASTRDGSSDTGRWYGRHEFVEFDLQNDSGEYAAPIGRDNGSRDSPPFGWAVETMGGGSPSPRQRHVVLEPSGLTVAEYCQIAQALVERDHDRIDLIAQGFQTMVNTRRQRLIEAMEDTHHWPMMLRPAALVDIDAVVLIALYLNADLPPGLYPYLSDDSEPALHAPLYVAQLMMGAPLVL
ncbi:conserved protein of unknown function [Pararobbsia alpina]|uniref:hypothetical protein n=1 Tax=Pararobbsia alpina TaxID=621374 RepID=UPI0039A4A1D6